MTETTAKEEFEDRIAYLVSIGKLIPIEGDFYTVMGLPGGRLLRFLQDFAEERIF